MGKLFRIMRVLFLRGSTVSMYMSVITVIPEGGVNIDGMRKLKSLRSRMKQTRFDTVTSQDQQVSYSIGLLNDLTT